ncbi:hypothetical protein V5O48_002092 [Marasmius crinis-equi]|uniref:N-acetyltransferase domain-containing protein n=1 Tax=Marasmius crinis-equi TaxID=585013 RepID=A0ABR3FWM2_9AGAR
MARDALLAGQIMVAETPEDGILGAGFYFGPGQVMLGSEKQREQGFNQLIRSVNEDARRWFTGYFLEEMLRGSVEGVYGPGVERDHYHIPYGGVLPNHKGKGVGKALIQHVEEKAKSEGLDVVLETFTPGNVAIYEKLGYKVEGIAYLEHPAVPESMKLWCFRKRLNTKARARL